MKRLKKIITCILIISLTVAMVNVPAENKTTVQAAINKEKALKSYVKALKKVWGGTDKLSVCTFALIDLNGDRIPEFLASQDDGYHMDIYAYVNGKAKRVGEGFAGGRIYYPNIYTYYSWTIHTGAYDREYYRFNGKKMIQVCSKHGSSEYNAITGKKKTIKEVEQAKDEFAPYLYKVNGKKTTKAKYDETVRHIKKRGRKAKIIVHKATKQNIRKYLDKNYLQSSSNSSDNLNNVIKHAREIYYGVNEKLKKYKKNSEKGNYTEYWNGDNLVKAVTYPGNVGDIYIKGYTSEFYYDSNHRLVFSFAYKKTSKGVKEFRAYYGKDGKLYRYIDSNGKIVDYKKGKSISKANSLAKRLFNAGSIYKERAML